VTLPIEVGRQAEGDDVDRRRRNDEVASQDAPTKESFDHVAADDLASLLEMYARPDRRVLERRSPTPERSPFAANDRRVGDRRSPSAETSPHSSSPQRSNDPQETPSISSIPEGSNVTPEPSEGSQPA
jgi:hypothetical protein